MSREHTRCASKPNLPQNVVTSTNALRRTLAWFQKSEDGRSLLAILFLWLKVGVGRQCHRSRRKPLRPALQAPWMSHRNCTECHRQRAADGPELPKRFGGCNSLAERNLSADVSLLEPRPSATRLAVPACSYPAPRALVWKRTDTKKQRGWCSLRSAHLCQRRMTQVHQRKAGQRSPSRGPHFDRPASKFSCW